MPFCSECGHLVHAQDVFCEECGTDLRQHQASVPPSPPVPGPAPAPQPSPPPPSPSSLYPQGPVQPSRTPPPPSPPESRYPPPSKTLRERRKSPGLAALASFLLAGLGQVYNGNLLKGLGVFLGVLIGSLFFVIPGVAVFLYGIFDAYSTAQKMNTGERPFEGHSWFQIALFLVIVAVVVFIVYLIVLAIMVVFMEYVDPEVLSEVFGTE